MILEFLTVLAAVLIFSSLAILVVLERKKLKALFVRTRD